MKKVLILILLLLIAIPLIVIAEQQAIKIDYKHSEKGLRPGQSLKLFGKIDADYSGSIIIQKYENKKWENFKKIELKQKTFTYSFVPKEGIYRMKAKLVDPLGQMIVESSPQTTYVYHLRKTKKEPVEAKMFNAKQAYHYVSKMVEFGNRYPTNKIEHKKALNYIIKALRGFGLKPKEQSFPTGIVPGTNVIVSLPKDKNSYQKEWIVVGAHYDSEDSVGANDNGAGVAVLLELARDLAKFKLPYNLKLVFFDSEEMRTASGEAHPGSRYFYRQLTPGQKANFAAMINIDGPGYGLSPLYVGDDIDGDNWIINHIYLTALGLNRKVIKAGRDEFQGYSDYEIFTKSGISAAAVSADGPQHSEADNLNNVHLTRLNSAGKIVLKSLLTLK